MLMVTFSIRGLSMGFPVNSLRRGLTTLGSTFSAFFAGADFFVTTGTFVSAAFSSLAGTTSGSATYFASSLGVGFFGEGTSDLAVFSSVGAAFSSANSVNLR
jgi:hypothetical protein